VKDVRTTSGGREFEALDDDVCWELVAHDSLGRIAYTQGETPAIRPVNYFLSGHDVLIRTTSSSEMGRAIDGHVVALEVDQIERSTRSGWVVVVVGKATATDLAGQPPRPSLGGLEPWSAGEGSLLLHIEADTISGRRLTAPSGLVVGDTGLEPVTSRV
jgi:uncharacterized protein